MRQVSEHLTHHEGESHVDERGRTRHINANWKSARGVDLITDQLGERGAGTVDMRTDAAADVV